MATAFPADPDSPCGGVEAVSVTLLPALSRLDDLELHVVTVDRSCRAPAHSTWNGVTVHRLPQLARRMLTNAIGPGRRQVSRFLTELAPDVVHAHDVYGLMVKGLPIPRVFTVHGFIHKDTRVAGGRLARVRSLLWRWVESATWADQPHVISISPYVRERLSGVVRGVIYDIENPISETFFGVSRRERGNTIFSAAFIGSRKNTLGLVKALARLVSTGVTAELRLAGGTTDPAYAARVAQCIEANGLRDRVKLLGPLGHQSILDELASASVFALVSLEENAPMGVAEAMAAGLPVVTSNRCGMPYMVRHGESGFLVDPENPDEIASRLKRFLENEALRHAAGERSRQIALDRFHPDRVARRTVEVYLEALHRSDHLHVRAAG